MSTNRSNYMKSYMKVYNADPDNKRKKMLWMRRKRAGFSTRKGQIRTHYAIGGQRWREVVKNFLGMP